MAEKASVVLSSLGAIRSQSTAFSLLLSMRPHQWLKNLFVLAPLLFGRKLGDADAVVRAVLAFSAFCFMASSLYIFNDIVDAAEDRAHPTKRQRPIPSGALPMRAAVAGSSILLFAALWIAWRLDTRFLLLIGVYWASMICYCLGLKRASILDAMTIALGFVLRVLGGAIAVQVVPTHWLIACAFLLALFLAFAKRRQELITLASLAGRHRQVLSTYTVSFLDQVNNILIGATIVCYALYTVAPETVARFGTDALVYGTVFVIYGLLRYMALIQNPVNGGDPGRLLIKDKPMLAAVFCWSVYNVLIVYNTVVRSIWDQWF